MLTASPIGFTHGLVAPCHTVTIVSGMVGTPLSSAMSFKSSLLLEAHEDARTTAAQQRLPIKLIKVGVNWRSMRMATSDGVTRNVRKEVTGGMVRCREESAEARGSAGTGVASHIS